MGLHFLRSILFQSSGLYALIKLKKLDKSI